MMDAVKAGGDRQELHERIRELSMEAGRTVKVEGRDNDLLERIAGDPAFKLSLEDLKKSMDPARYTGCARPRWKNTLKISSGRSWIPTGSCWASALRSTCDSGDVRG